ncbi:MAG: hypothetical protein JWM78_3548 [Verrucomicrobiaceae bacterium]|nr:hypothetical protein [Verrucomicrobiaceae bacterium]
MTRIVFLLMMSLLCCSLPTRADTNPPEIETSKKFGNYTVFYNVFPSTDLQADIAARYNITRANDRVVLNVSLRDSSNGDIRPQRAATTGTYSDLMSNKPLEFREISELNAIYYIAELRVSNRELLRFDINVQPIADTEKGEQTSPPLIVTFTRKFAVDN